MSLQPECLVSSPQLHVDAVQNPPRLLNPSPGAQSPVSMWSLQPPWLLRWQPRKRAVPSLLSRPSRGFEQHQFLDCNQMRNERRSVVVKEADFCYPQTLVYPFPLSPLCVCLDDTALPKIGGRKGPTVWHRNFFQYLMITHDGNESEQEYICVYAS